MSSKAQWGLGAGPITAEQSEPLFFTAHEWETVEAATSRLYPTDDTPGAKEAGVTLFIDRYVSGIDYVYATADGAGFLRLSGRHADSWRARVARLQKLYRDGVARLDQISRDMCGREFKRAEVDDQDRVLEAVSGQPKPTPVTLSDARNLGTMLQGVSDDGVSFFDALAIHTRQGMFCDPAYGGNRNRVGWSLVGFPGPESLADTKDASFSLKEYFVQDYSWDDLIPHLKKAGSG